MVITFMEEKKKRKKWSAKLVWTQTPPASTSLTNPVGNTVMYHKTMELEVRRHLSSFMICSLSETKK